jgi:hypothetical protein
MGPIVPGRLSALTCDPLDLGRARLRLLDELETMRDGRMPQQLVAALADVAGSIDLARLIDPRR